MNERLRTAPFDIDPQAIAEGMLEMFSDEERTVLRFGMLPYEKMQVLDKCLREKFMELCRTDPSGDDAYAAWCKDEHTGGPSVVDFKMSKLVSEASHLVSLAIYKSGDLVV